MPEHGQVLDLAELRFVLAAKQWRSQVVTGVGNCHTPAHKNYFIYIKKILRFLFLLHISALLKLSFAPRDEQFLQTDSLLTEPAYKIQITCTYSLSNPTNSDSDH